MRLIIVVFSAMLITGLAVYYMPRSLEKIKNAYTEKGYLSCVQEIVSSIDYYGYIDVPTSVDAEGNIQYMRLTKDTTE